MGSWRKVIAQFENDLNQEEKVVFKYATLQGLLKDVAVLEETQRKSSKLRQLSVKIQPLLDAIEDYGKALDVLANASSVLPVIWGSLRVLLAVSQSRTLPHNNKHSFKMAR